MSNHEEAQKHIQWAITRAEETGEDIRRVLDDRRQAVYRASKVLEDAEKELKAKEAEMDALIEEASSLHKSLNLLKKADALAEASEEGKNV